MCKRLALSLGMAALAAGVLALVRPARTHEPEVPVNDAAAQPKPAASRITHVTVYPDSALVTREVEVPAGNGLFELVVTPLPQHVLNSSLYSEGSNGTRVLTTRFRTRPVKEDTREEVRKLEDEAKKLQMTAQRLQADLTAAQQNLQLLGKLENFTSANTQQATEKGRLDSDATIALAKYLMEGRGDKSRETVSLQQQIQLNQEQLQYVQRQLRDLTAGSSRTERDAIIVVEKTDAAPGNVRLNYLVSSAAWRPQYKLRAGSKEKDPIQMEYLAAITQQTGEDWQNVRLFLSTAQPMLNAAPPQLKLLALTAMPQADLAAAGKPQGDESKKPAEAQLANQSVAELGRKARELRGRAQAELNYKGQAAGTQLFNEAAAVETACELVVSATEKPLAKGLLAKSSSNEGPSVTYHLPARLSVPSRNDEQVLEVAKLELAPEYYFKAVPVLTRHVYRLADLTNTSPYVLLPGEATMYTGSDFVGRMDLPLVAIGEQFTVGFGVEPQLQVQRQLVDKSRSLQGGNQVLRYEYRMLVSSYKPERVRLQLWDRLPVGENELVGVSLVKAAPELSKDPLYQREERPNNLLRWDVEVGPERSGEKALAVGYEFKLELERQMTISNFTTKLGRTV
jgi:hypothetical protein